MSCATRRWLVVVMVAMSAAGAARGDDAPAPPTLKQLREDALAAVASDEAGTERARAVAALGAADDAEGAQALVECVATLGIRRTTLDVTHDATLESYIPYQGFKDLQPAEWEMKAHLLKVLAKEDRQAQGLTAIADAAIAAIAKRVDPAGLTVLVRAAPGQADANARYVLYCGLLANPNARNNAELVKKALKDPMPLVRVAALDAIRALKDAALLDLAVPALDDAGWPLRIAAVRALDAIGDARAVPHLVSAMQVERGGLLDEYGSTLGRLTGERHGRHPDAWRKWYEANKAELARNGMKLLNPKPAPKAPPPPAVNYYGIETSARRVLFIVDVSGSMKEPIGSAAPTTAGKDAERPSGPKIEIAKRMLVQAVQKLEKGTTFNVVFFSHQVQCFREKMLPATDETKAELALTVTDIEPIGATWAYGALRKAFELADATATSKSAAFDPQVDTIFFLSDGAPTDEGVEKAQPMDPKVILAAVREWNRLARIPIHAIAIDPSVGRGTFVEFMRGLASQSGGTYTAIGAKDKDK